MTISEDRLDSFEEEFHVLFRYYRRKLVDIVRQSNRLYLKNFSDGFVYVDMFSDKYANLNSKYLGLLEDTEDEIGTTLIRQFEEELKEYEVFVKRILLKV
ncbi:MAG: hypothetical protein LBV67_11555 [Streptococcaceae bacterium]|jgi:hypothetical protein|nr:hypothetical protein [Streptococcaceae bacterium]